MHDGNITILHALPGRVRLRMPAIKGDPGASRRVEEHLAAVREIRGVAASPVTGSVLVTYDPARTAALAGLAERLMPGVDASALLARPVSPGPSPDPESNGDGRPVPLADRLVEATRRLNDRFATTTGGPDLALLVPVLLAALGVRGLLTSEKLPIPAWYDFFWFAFGAFFMLNRPGDGPATAPSVDPGPPPPG